MMIFNKLDTSNELQVYRFANGIKLVQPNTRHKISPLHEWHTKHTVSSLLTIPCSIYFDNVDGEIQILNEHNVELCGLDSSQQAIGKKYFTRFSSQTTRSLLKNDSEIMKEKKIQLYEETILQHDSDTSVGMLSIKMPWYNHLNNVIGLFGCSMTLAKHSLANSLTAIAKLGFLIPEKNIFNRIEREINYPHLSKQQMRCAKLLLTGISLKEIASRLQLSPRTVESYIDNIKSKLKCINKTDVIIKLHEMMKHDHS